MTHTKIYAEEYVLKQDREIQTSLRASDILKTKAPIPDGFIKLEVGKGNYSRTTNPEWTKILSERYDFSYQDGKK